MVGYSSTSGSKFALEFGSGNAKLAYVLVPHLGVNVQVDKCVEC